MTDGENKSLSVAFSDSLEKDVIGCIGEYTELGIDAILDDGVLKEIPVVSTAIAIFKIGNSIRDRHNLKKLAIFLDEINKGIAEEEKRSEYQSKFQGNEKFRNQELEYLLVLIDRYVSYDKPRMLAKIYLAYLDNTISLEELSMYSEVIDRLLSLDYSALISEKPVFVFHNHLGTESFLRLVALGLMVEDSSDSMWQEDGRGGFSITSSSMQRAKLKEQRFSRTVFGKKLADILR